MNKASGGDGIPAELFQILKDDAVKVLHSKLGKLQSGHRSGKGQFSFQSQRKAVKEYSNNCTYLTCQQRNAENPPNQASTVHGLRTTRYSSWIQKRQKNQKSNCQHLQDEKKAREFQRKTSTSASLTMLNPYTMWIKTKLLKRQKYQSTLPVS